MPYDLSAVLRRVDARRMRELLVDFANVPSIPEDPSGPAEWYAGLLRASGAVESRVIDDVPHSPCVVAGFPGVRRSPTLQFSGYLDTDGGNARRAYAASGKIFGKGVASAKGGLIAAAEAARVLSEYGPVPGGGLLMVARSRRDTPDARPEDLLHLIERGIVGQAVVITADDHDVAPIMGLGLGLFRAVFTAPPDGAAARAHLRTSAAGASSLAATPIDAAHAFCTQLRRRSIALVNYKDTHGAAESVTVGQIVGGERIDRVPSSCCVQGAWRWLPERSAWDVYGELEAMARKAAVFCGMRAEVTLEPACQAYRLDQGEPIVASLCAAFHDVWNAELPFGASVRINEVPTFLEKAGVAAVCHGPHNHAAGIDPADESVSIDELTRTARVYISLALHYLGGVPGAPLAATYATANQDLTAPAPISEMLAEHAVHGVRT